MIALPHLPSPTKSLLLLCTALLIALSTQAQQRVCPTPYEQGLHDHDIRQRNERFESWLQQKMELRRKQQAQGLQKDGLDAVVTLPVVVHIIHNGEPVGEGTNISDEQILSQIAVLNEDFRRNNADTVETPAPFLPVAADIEIEFQLAARDPEGRPTNGINRVQGFKNLYNINSDADDIKALSAWPAEDYLNFWVAPIAAPFLGLAQFPLSDLEALENQIDPAPETDGVLMGHQYFGSSIKGDFPELAAPYDLGRTTTHEVGHFLGLRHIWGDGGCSFDDGCADTPLAEQETLGCDLSATCGSADMIQNYMDFTDDLCMNLFTACQKERMLAVLQFSPRRSSLLNSNALEEPVLVANDMGIRQFLSPASSSCADNPEPIVQVRNYGTNEVNNFTIRLLVDEVERETVSISNISLPPDGLFSVSFAQLIDLNSLTELSVEIDQVNGVADANSNNNKLTELFYFPEPAFGSFTEDFTIFPAGWAVRNPENDATWQFVNAPAEEPTNLAMRMPFYNNNNLGTFDILTTPALEFTGVEEVLLSFRLAYSSQDGGFPEGLIVAVSTDCGATFPQSDWIIMRYGESLATAEAPPGGLPFSPDGPEDWREVSLFLNRYIDQSNVVIGFIGLNGNGNHLYLDDISLQAEKIFDFNLAIEEVIQPSSVSCTGLVSPEVLVRNTGSEPIAEFTAEIFVDGQSFEQVVETEALLPGRSRTVTFSDQVFTPNQYEWTTRVEITGATDENPEDNEDIRFFIINDERDSPPALEKVEATDPAEFTWKPINTFSEITWEQTPAAGYGKSDNQAFWINAFQNGISGERIRLISPSFDMSNVTEASLQFAYSYASDDFSRDRLRILVSRNCDLTDLEELDNRGQALLSVADTLIEWFPSEEDHWRRQAVNLNNFAGESELRLVLEFENQQGNNIFVDDLELYLSNRTNPANRFIRPFDIKVSIWPNPNDEPTFNLTFDLDEKQDLVVDLLDLTGRVLNSQRYPNTLNQTYSLDITGRDNGIYLIRVTGQGFTTTKRFRLNY